MLNLKPIKIDMKNQILILISSLFLYSSFTNASVFYVDPNNGSIENPGSPDLPWKTLEEVINNKLVETKDNKGNLLNAGAPVKSGDTIILRSGYHGLIKITNAFNDQLITVKGEDGSSPQLGYLELRSAKNWRFEQVIISPSHSSSAVNKATIAILGDSNYWGNSSNLELVDSHIYTAEDTQNWSKDNWVKQAKIGIIVGRYTLNTLIKNNYIRNVSNGVIVLSEGADIEGNVVSHFADDGIKVNANGTRVTYNILKNAINPSNIHNDGIQAYKVFNNPSLDDFIIENNIILTKDTNQVPFSSVDMQGIGLFDGPYNNGTISNNVILVSTWHGIGLFDGTNTTITNNIIFSTALDRNIKSRITLSSKKGKNPNDVVNENDVFGNISTGYHPFESLVAANNVSEDENLYRERLNALLNTIQTKYGPKNVLANKSRLSEELLGNAAPASQTSLKSASDTEVEAIQEIQPTPAPAAPVATPVPAPIIAATPAPKPIARPVATATPLPAAPKPITTPAPKPVTTTPVAKPTARPPLPTTRQSTSQTNPGKATATTTKPTWKPRYVNRSKFQRWCRFTRNGCE